MRNALTIKDNGNYSCVVLNSIGSDTSKVYTLSVAADTTKPVISSLSPQDGFASSDSLLSVSFIVTDESGILKVVVNESSVVSNDSVFQDTLKLSPGVNTITIIATDASYHKNSDTLKASYMFTPSSYKIIYNGNGHTSGTVPVDTNTYGTGSTVSVIGNTGALVKTGNAFSGWNTKVDGTGASYASGDTLIMDTVDIVLFAQWTVNPTYTVTYNGNGHTSGIVPVDTNNYESGTTVAIKGNTGTLLKDSCTFADWNTKADGTGTSYSEGDSFTMDTLDIVLYARWTKNPTFKVTYNGNGHTSGIVPLDNNNYEEGVTVTVLGNTGHLAKTGHTFTGWNTQADGTGKNYTDDDTFTMDTIDVMLYAKWATNPTYIVTYSGNGNTSGAVPVDIHNYEEGVTVTVLGNTGSLTKTGHTFAGWNTKSDGTGISYTRGETFPMDTADVVLYAKWTTNPTYSVTYNGNGNTSGTVPVDMNNYEVGDIVTVLGNTGSLIKIGYSFSSWNTKADGTGTKYSNADTFYMGSADETLYAKWITNSYIVRFNSNGGSLVDSQSVPYNNTATEPAPPTRIGYTFAGWYSDQALTIPFVFTTAITVSITLYAKWTPVYTVTYNGNSNTGGTVPVDTNKYTNGTSVTVLDNKGSLVKTGYSFSKWNTNQAGSGTDRTPGETFTIGSQNVTLYAKWAINVYTMTFDSRGGSAVTSQQINHGSQATEPSSPTKKGYNFEGWYKDSAHINIWNFSSDVVTDNVTLYAKWVIRDTDGNIYTEIQIGNQVWMVENFRCTKYNDGTTIPNVTDSAQWQLLTTPAYCWYNNDSSTNATPYGALYNWRVVDPANLKKIAPNGWRVPTDADWTTLQNFLIANGYNWDGTTTGNKIAKSMASKIGWETWSVEGTPGNDPNNNNGSGFSGFPGGGCYHFDSFNNQKYSCEWWSTSEEDEWRAYARMLGWSSEYLYRDNSNKISGLSVRLIKNMVD